MITLAASEHLEKIPYLFSLFWPVLLFFLAGLALAWLLWYKNARRLSLALEEHERLSAELSSTAQNDLDMGTRFTGLFQKHSDHWKSELKQSEGKVVKLNDELSKESTRFADLNLSYEKYKETSEPELARIGSLEGDLSKNVTALGLLQTKFDDGEGETKKLRSKISDLEGSLGGKDQEIEKLRNLHASLEKRAGEKEAEIKGLQERIATLEASSSGLQSELESLQGQLGDRDTKVGGLESDLAKNATAFGLLQSKFDDGQGEADKLRSQLKDLDSNLGGKDKELEQLRNQYASLEKGTAEKEAEIQSLRGKIAELEKSSVGLQNELSGVQGQLGDRDKKVGGLESDIAKNATAFGLLQSKFDEGKGEADKLRGQVKDLDSNLGAKDKELEKLRNQQAALEKGSSEKEAEIKTLRGKISELEKSSNGLQQDLSGLKGQLGDRDKKIGSLESDLKSAKDRKPEPIGAATFFANTGAAQDQKHGFLYKSRPSKVDDLTEISGVGPVLQPKLNEAGIYQFKQVALWSKENIEAFSGKLDFAGRVEREQWVNQAADLHRQHYGEHLAPIVDIYHKAKTRTIVKDAGPSLDDFESEDVKVDEKLGVLYNKKPDKTDDLKRIKGVADVLEGKLHDFGVYRFKQVALWNKANIDEFSERLSFPDRIERDQWIAQALEFHHEEYEERLAPRYTVFHNAPTPKPAKPAKEATGATYPFEGEPVRKDPKLGILYTERPVEIDDLKKIKGVAAVLEEKLHEFGLYRFKQIALWTDEQVEEFSEQLAFPGRVERDEWVKQAAAFHAQKYGVS